MRRPPAKLAVLARCAVAALSFTDLGASVAQAEPNAAGVGTGDPTVVVTTSGPVQGVVDDAGVVYKGLPYAAPPVGALRWHAPVPPQPWGAPRVADRFGAPCAQAALRGRTEVSSVSSEDCLYLNVWRPRARARAALPVMVWIHGGGFQNGSGTSSTYDGSRLARKGVIVVTLNYRLGVFGFLAHPELKTEAGGRSSGNYGLQDQIAALRWVRENIAAFGGNPSNVTIFGQSAGGASVLDLVVSRAASGLFRRAIVESGAARTAMSAAPVRVAEQQGAAFAGQRSLSELRAQGTAAVLAQAGDAATRGIRFGPVIDGTIIDGEPAELLRARRSNAVALLIGSNSREGLAVLPDEKLDAQLATAFGANANQAVSIYRSGSGKGGADPIMGTPAEQFATDSTFRCGSVAVARASASAGMPTWQYQFEHFVPGRENLGAAHSFEVPYVFGNLSKTGFSGADYGSSDQGLSELMMTYWTNFAKRGDPNGPGLPIWARHTDAKPVYLRLSAAFPRNAALASDLRGGICRLFSAE